MKRGQLGPDPEDKRFQELGDWFVAEDYFHPDHGHYLTESMPPGMTYAEWVSFSTKHELLPPLPIPGSKEWHETVGAAGGETKARKISEADDVSANTTLAGMDGIGGYEAVGTAIKADDTSPEAIDKPLDARAVTLDGSSTSINPLITLETSGTISEAIGTASQPIKTSSFGVSETREASDLTG
jgi:hypothetical protein